MNEEEACPEKDPMKRDCLNCLEREFCDWCPDEDFDAFMDGDCEEEEV